MTDKINLSVFKKFFSSNTSGGILLFLCVVISLIIANTSASNAFNELLQVKLGFENETIQLRYSIKQWIDDGLMAIFFLLVGLEIKRELVEGELSSPKNAILPILAAVGGAIVPALIYTIFNHDQASHHGWGIPMATDIAFALAIISLLDKRVPPSLKIFLAALAIVDDLLAILVIAIFYSTELHYTYLLYAAGITGLLVVFNRTGVKNIWAYIIPGLFIWYFIHHSGIHATIAGVLVAMTLPTTPDATESPLEKLEHALANPVNFIIIPLFALVNTNISIHSEMVHGLQTPLGLGIILGLFFGKTIGIYLTTWICVKTKLANLPDMAGWKHMIGVGMLGGIGFTMSIFISMLSFKDPLFIEEAKFAVLIGSLISGTCGYLYLSFVAKKDKFKVD
ncbi:Na(+)/H(+) antiporter NhaA [Sphingobacterium mizutaii NBRC 14946 = DSM 11724]|uniref:Na(+)/H(+) antiporter NhaA n=2 Tax=Sphingobacterium mizutaii TaxID=1010 RepID=A0AAJ5C0F2_9SPHI|nr:Na+/H+ antiporter NhaA [Sphingobacterium mizutaii]GEM67452.1 Na(+)/H(+) antiporter NhaA [Sphingobacterium mizutaii NBRC 14946 = DSM 11724]SDL05761.1 Na+:H+ antiporter, NhaA family [Sphingobacterium mizutaii]SNV50836.1 Sodium/proton antiporter nhaA [Sphingobacterium mizutaii]